MRPRRKATEQQTAPAPEQQLTVPAPEQQLTAPAPAAPPSLLRTVAVYRVVKLAGPLKVRKDFLQAFEAKISEDLHRSVVRARTSGRSTLMRSDV